MSRRKLLVLNLKLFDDVMNATTSKTSGNDLSAEMKTYYSDYLIDIAGPKLVHRPGLDRGTRFPQKPAVKPSNLESTAHLVSLLLH